MSQPEDPHLKLLKETTELLRENNRILGEINQKFSNLEQRLTVLERSQVPLIPQQSSDGGSMPMSPSPEAHLAGLFTGKSVKKDYIPKPSGSETVSWEMVFRNLTEKVYCDVYEEPVIPAEAWQKLLKSKSTCRVATTKLITSLIETYQVEKDTTWERVQKHIQAKVIAELERKLDGILALSSAQDHWAANDLIVKFWLYKHKRVKGGASKTTDYEENIIPFDSSNTSSASTSSLPNNLGTSLLPPHLSSQAFSVSAQPSASDTIISTGNKRKEPTEANKTDKRQPKSKK